jgi:hypothetical protein
MSQLMDVGLAWLTRCAAVSASLSQWFLFIGTSSPDVSLIGRTFLFIIINSALLVPLFLVRKGSSGLNWSLLIGLMFAGLAAYWITHGSHDNDNGTTPFIVPIPQWVCMGLAAVCGYSIESDRSRK